MFKKRIDILTVLLFVSALGLSTISAFYAVSGLVAIFAASVVPIIVMGSMLEVSKLVVASWLYRNWQYTSYLLRTYFCVALTVLMMLTSMGIFGYLSKAHLDQAVPTGDVASQVSILDERIKTEKDNIDSARKALAQLDAQVNETIARTTDDKGTERSIQVRRSQQKERSSLLSEIQKAQTKISQLNEERAPINSKLRKVEAEVGPIKYIAKFIYGDKGADENFLERAVTWIIILIVTVFDPLAVIMLLGAQMTFMWFKEQREEAKAVDAFVEQAAEETFKDIEPAEIKEPAGFVAQEVAEVIPEAVAVEETPDDPIPCYKCGTPLVDAPGIGLYCPNPVCDIIDDTDPEAEPVEIVYTPPQSLKHWPFPAQYKEKVEEPQPKPKRERKPRKTKQTEEKVNEPKSEENTPAPETAPAEQTIPATIKAPKAKKVKPERDLSLEQQQAQMLEAIIESSTGSQGGITPPADNAPVRTGTVGAPLPGDEYYGKEEELKPTPRRSEAGGWFPNKTK